jgi:hypothetical protein
MSDLSEADQLKILEEFAKKLTHFTEWSIVRQTVLIQGLESSSSVFWMRSSRVIPILHIGRRLHELKMLTNEVRGSIRNQKRTNGKR